MQHAYNLQSQMTRCRADAATRLKIIPVKLGQVAIIAQPSAAQYQNTVVIASLITTMLSLMQRPMLGSQGRFCKK